MTVRVGPFERVVAVSFGGAFGPWRYGRLYSYHEQVLTHNAEAGATALISRTYDTYTALRVQAYLDDDANQVSERVTTRDAATLVSGEFHRVDSGPGVAGANVTTEPRFDGFVAASIVGDRLYQYVSDGATSYQTGPQGDLVVPINNGTPYPLETHQPIPGEAPELALLANGSYDLHTVAASSDGLHAWATTALIISDVVTGQPDGPFESPAFEQTNSYFTSLTQRDGPWADVYLHRADVSRSLLYAASNPAPMPSARWEEYQPDRFRPLDTFAPQQQNAAPLLADFLAEANRVGLLTDLPL